MDCISRNDDAGIDFEEDPRYRIASREALIAVGYWVVYTVAVTAVAWGLGVGKPASEIQFVWGFPAWFFWSAGVVTLIFCIVPYFIAKYLFADMSLMPYGEVPPTEARDGSSDAGSVDSPPEAGTVE